VKHARAADPKRTLRAFAAIELDAAARSAAAAGIRALRELPGGGGVRWVREEALHVTLRFLGDVARERLPALQASFAAAAAGHARFELAFSGVQLFPTAARPRAVALGIGPEAPLAALARSFEAAAVACGFAPETRGFRAHLTLGRLRSARGARSATAPASRFEPARARIAPARFEVDHAVLFQSEPCPDGSRYTALSHFPLGAVPGVRDHP